MAGGDSLPRFSYDMREVSGQSADLFHYLEKLDITVGQAAVILALTLGRLQSPVTPLTDDKAKSYVSSVMDFGEMFFAEGKVN